MKIKMLTVARGADISLDMGKEYDLEKEFANELIKGGYAVSLEPKAETKGKGKGKAQAVETPEGNEEIETPEAPLALEDNSSK